MTFIWLKINAGVTWNALHSCFLLNTIGYRFSAIFFLCWYLLCYAVTTFSGEFRHPGKQLGPDLWPSLCVRCCLINRILTSPLFLQIVCCPSSNIGSELFLNRISMTITNDHANSMFPISLMMTWYSRLWPRNLHLPFRFFAPNSSYTMICTWWSDWGMQLPVRVQHTNRSASALRNC